MRARPVESIIKSVEIYSPTAQERQLFIDACMPVYDFYIKKGTFSQQELDAVRKVAMGN
ncbi:MAG: hypothetical protein ABIJ86_10880 [Spirochaetota bacterium]